MTNCITTNFHAIELPILLFHRATRGTILGNRCNYQISRNKGFEERLVV